MGLLSLEKHAMLQLNIWGLELLCTVTWVTKITLSPEQFRFVNTGAMVLFETAAPMLHKPGPLP